jgi:pantoate--beta-alanine ligase
VEKLFTIFYPDFAYFGEKDFQQVIIIKALVEQQELSTKIISCPTIRENDGLAMSSRNQLLKEGYRKNAALIHNSLLEAKQLMKSMNPPQLEKMVAAKFFNAEGVALEYFKVLTNDSLAERKKFNKAEAYRAFIACKIGEVRLIDNIILT